MRVREGTTEMVNHDNLRAPLQQSQKDAAKVGKNNFDSFGLLSGSVPFDGEEFLPFKVENHDDSVHSKASPSDPIVQLVDNNTKSTSYARAAGASTKESPRVISNFRPLLDDSVFDSFNIYIPRKVVEKSSFARCLIEVNSKTDLVDVVTIGVPSLTGYDFTKETIHVEYEWRPPRCYLCKIFGHVHDDCPKRVMSPPIVTTSNVVTPTVVKTNDGFQTAIPSTPKKGSTYVGNASKSSIMSKTTSNSSKNDNIITSNSYSALNEEEHKQEDFENVYDETANLFPNTKTSGSSSFTAAAG
uniref:Zinc knuckle CX2CX4HX4C n=1 Tax=Tanacetum cinerariifolium TaxID=118510 RepID=A0A6L2K557_TANCI|nr:hypothetical protein [Tanacetum cinerariifolium]